MLCTRQLSWPEAAPPSLFYQSCLFSSSTRISRRPVANRISSHLQSDRADIFRIPAYVTRDGCIRDCGSAALRLAGVRYRLWIYGRGQTSCYLVLQLLNLYRFAWSFPSLEASACHVCWQGISRRVRTHNARVGVLDCMSLRYYRALFATCQCGVATLLTLS